MKTPEQLAEEYADDWHKDCDYPAEILRHTKKATETVFLAGYQAGRLNSEGVQAAKDQLADGKVMFCVYCNDMHKGDCAECKGKNHPALRGTQWISVKERLPEEVK